MRNFREVFRLKLDASLFVRIIAASMRISIGSASNYLHRFINCGLTWPTFLSAAELERCLLPPAPTVPSDQRLTFDWACFYAELRRPGVTLALLWQEYRLSEEPPRTCRVDAPATDPLGRTERFQQCPCYRLHPRTPNPLTARLPSCLGILRLNKQEAACQRALALGACSYKSLASILRQGLERLPLAQQNQMLLPDEHINLRGPGYCH